MKSIFDKYKEILLLDFEFQPNRDGAPKVVCLVVHELKSGKKLRFWKDALERMNEAPYSLGERSLFVSYFATAELSCHLALNWKMPTNVLDLFVEFRNQTNGLPLKAGKSLLGALSYYGLPAIEDLHKEKMRNLVLNQNEWSESEREEILQYCESDVIALGMLLQKMEPHLDIERALMRGEYMKSVAKIEVEGIPIDASSLNLIRSNVEIIQNALINETNLARMVYEGTTFKEEGFRRFLQFHDIPWPTTTTGKLRLDDDTFKSLSETYPVIVPIRQLRQSLSQLRSNELAVGADSKSRCMVSPFSSKTSRNQPSNSRFIFGLAKWFRFLIQPQKGKAVAYLDWSQQEFGIAAALSKDESMLEAYRTGDPYLAFAKQAGAVPPEATKDTHEPERELFKSCALAVQYGMGATGLAFKINKTKPEARELIDLHRKTYPKFWNWSDACVNRAMQTNRLNTVFGWNCNITDEVTIPSLKNFPMQSNGAEMLRVATILAHRSGLKICALIHDAMLIEAPEHLIESHTLLATEAMAHASRIVLDGFELKTDFKIYKSPDRFFEKKGKDFWDTVRRCLSDIKKADTKGISDLPKNEQVMPQILSPGLSP